MAAVESLNEGFFMAGTWQEFGLSHTGILVGGLELSGVDPQGKGPADFDLFTVMLRNILQSLSPNLRITQYFWHYEGVARVSLRERNDPRAQLITKGRQELMDRRGFAGTRLFWLLEVPSTQAVNGLLSMSFLRALFESPFSAEARARLKAKLSYSDAWMVEENELFEQVQMLRKELNDLQAKLEVLSGDRTQLTRQKLWALCRATANLNPTYLDSAVREAVPQNDWDKRLGDGDWKPVTLEEMTVLKLDAARPTYARIASVLGFGETTVPPSIWAHEPSQRPVGLRGNYLIVTRFSPINRLARSSMLSGKENELYRGQMKMSAMLTGSVGESELERKVESSPSIKNKLNELDEAANSPDRYWYAHSHVVVFGHDAKQLRATSDAMGTALSQSQLSVVWESAGLMDIFPMLQPTYPKRSYRSMELTSSQAGAASLVFRPHSGLLEWGVNREEAIFVFESDDGSPFHYTPYIGDKCLSIGVGPTRSGKSHLKVCIALAFQKLGGLYHAIGVDAGDEVAAQFFQEEGGIFRIDNGVGGRGFNPFVAAQLPVNGEWRDVQFANHMLSQIRMMLQQNDSEAMRDLEPYEQRQLDDAIVSTMLLRDAGLRNLSTMLNHCAPELQEKLFRWRRGGMYGHLFDNDVDGVGALNKRYAAYNMAAVKDIPTLASLAQNEVWFRLTRLFEDEKYRRMPKMLDIDEAQYLFKVPGVPELAVAKARTWFKHGGGMSFWTQNPEHYANLAEWETLRSSATTFWFLADQEMDPGMYARTFKLSEGEVDAIANLVPRRQAFVVQREIGVAKVINLYSTPQEHAIATSNPNEAPLVQEALRKHPDNIDAALREAIAAIAALNKKVK